MDREMHHLSGEELLLLLLAIAGACVGGARGVVVTVNPAEVTVARGQAAELPCSVSSNAPTLNNLVVLWIANTERGAGEQVLGFMAGQVVNGSASFAGRADFTSPMPGSAVSVRVERARESDAGTYTCSVNLIADPPGGVGVVTLTVLVPPATPRCTMEGDPTVGTNITLTCSSSEGNPAPSYLWTRLEAARKLPANAALGRKEGTLTLTNVSADSEGVYSCTARNSVGSSNCTITLALRIPPSVNVGPRGWGAGGLAARSGARAAAGLRVGAETQSDGQGGRAAQRHPDGRPPAAVRRVGQQSGQHPEARLGPQQPELGAGASVQTPGQRGGRPRPRDAQGRRLRPTPPPPSPSPPSPPPSPPTSPRAPPAERAARRWGQRARPRAGVRRGGRQRPLRGDRLAREPGARQRSAERVRPAKPLRRGGGPVRAPGQSDVSAVAKQRAHPISNPDDFARSDGLRRWSVAGSGPRGVPRQPRAHGRRTHHGAGTEPGGIPGLDGARPATGHHCHRPATDIS
ncbi:uncharacterized protein LOC144942952 isoform X2 [Lampetra fluviatilis]